MGIVKIYNFCRQFIVIVIFYNCQTNDHHRVNDQITAFIYVSLLIASSQVLEVLVSFSLFRNNSWVNSIVWFWIDEGVLICADELSLVVRASITNYDL